MSAQNKPPARPDGCTLPPSSKSIIYMAFLRRTNSGGGRAAVLRWRVRVRHVHHSGHARVKFAMGFRTSSEAQEPAAVQALVSHLALGFSVGAVLVAVAALLLAALARCGLSRRNFDDHLD